MNFVHDDPEFDELVRIVATKRGLSLALIEKDYWVTHALWAIHAQGFEVWFKGGTSLSKGFGLIQRFSEDLDLKLDPGSVDGMPVVENWHRMGATATQARRAYFEWLASSIVVPGADAQLDRERLDRHWRAAEIQIRYRGRHMADLGPDLMPFVLLEVGSARVDPCVPCDLTSFVHEELEAQGQVGDYVDNLPKGVRCVHPLVTLLEKLDALCRKAARADLEPSGYVRHYEDAARIAGATDLPPLTDYADVRALADEMDAQGQLKSIPRAVDSAFHPGKLDHAKAIRRAYERIEHMYWGGRITLEEACSTLREWIAVSLS